jgi:hypothetical protein
MTPTAPKDAPQTTPLTLSSVELKLDLVKVPAPSLNKGKGWVLWGAKHEFMHKVEELIRRSPTASALFNRKTALVAGDGFKVDMSQPAGPVIAAFLKATARTGKHRTGRALLREAARDNTRLRGRAYQVVWAKDGKHISEIHPQRFRTVASGPLNDQGEVEHYFICRDWRKQSQYPPKEIPAFNPETVLGADGTVVQPVQLYVRMRDGGENEYYPELDYEASLKYMELEAGLADYHGGNVGSNFSANTIITLQKGPETKTDPTSGNTITAQQQRDAFEAGLERKYTGASGRRLLVIYGNGSTQSARDLAQITPYSLTGGDGLYTTYAELAQQAILSACSCTSPVVAGLPGAGGLGDKGNELREAFDLFYNAVCRPEQEDILEDMRELLGYVVGIDFEGEDPKKPLLDITTTLPVKFTYSENLLELIKTDDELRADIGYDPLPAGAKPAAQPTGAPTAPPAPAV